MKRRHSSMQQRGPWSLLTAGCLGLMAIESAGQGPAGTIKLGDDPPPQQPNAAAPNATAPNTGAPGGRRRRGDDDDEMSRAIAPGQPPANAPAAATPGQPGRGIKPIQTGGPKPPPFESGTAQDTIYWFCVAVADGDTATASDYVAYSATGMAAKMREGELPEERIAELAEALNPTTDLGEVQQRRPSNLKRSIRNKRGQVISFVLKKDKEIYKIVEVTFTKPKEGKDAADTRDRS